ncbi:RNA-directed DNA polymerase [Cellvibrio sp. KY-GH-1]|uniref:RNA-directed DNA polymerase n=1 Tax=Cellvibrio sp. KY-GH-1 TaxID=2303332 RepID=UPI001CD9FFC6|nr:RNA-directed DNA polymerase [Cellvibrio sp. KY-GH-1]
MRTATRTSTTRIAATRREQSADVTAAPFTLGDLAQAYFDCRKAKRNSRSALLFEQNLERNLVQLQHELLNGTYKIGQSICFVITHPKPREVWAADFRDRIVHHLMYNHIATAIEAQFIADSCACIKGRGTLYGANRLEAKIRSATQNWKQDCYYLKCDLANFFVSIDKNILAELIAKKVSDPWWLALTLKILHHDPRQNYQLRCSPHTLNKVPAHKRLYSQPAHKGLAIGNLSSQFFANIYLNELDQFAKHELKARHYIRYVDDFVILHESAQWLNDCYKKIQKFLPERLAAQLNTSKTILQPVSRGVDFVGQVIKPWHRTTRKKTLNHALNQVAKKPATELRETANSYFGLLRQATNNFQARRKLAKTLFLKGKAVNQNLTKTYGKYLCHRSQLNQ